MTMTSQLANHRSLRALAGIAALGAMAIASPASAQVQRAMLPEGTVLSVMTETPINSRESRVGQVLVTRVTDPVSVEGRTVIPEGSRIEGTLSMVRAATSRESGLIGVDFTRVVLPNGRAFGIDGKLTSMDPAERRQIDAQGDGRVVFVGGRRGAGAAIGAIGAGDPSVQGLFGALGTLLSRGEDVTVPANTPLAVQLETGVTLTVTGPTRADESTIYTSADMIRAAQQSLRGRNYYRGAVDGRLTNETRRALFEFQLDNELFATGNLDGQTAAELGLNVAGSAAMGLTAAETALVRRNAQTVTSAWRDQLSITSAGRLSPNRTYFPAELELYFSLSAFADNASLYDQMTRTSNSSDGLRSAGLALLASARRVDAALQGVTAPARIVTAWRAIQSDLTAIDPTYR
jgi:peptidoglycan hydrolase-like protein with peptidoglycan-binding domain